MKFHISNTTIAKVAKRGVKSAAAGLIGKLVVAATSPGGAKGPLDFYDQPEYAANVLDSMGIALLNRDRRELGIQMIQRAFDLRIKFFGPNHPSTAQSLHSYTRVLRERGEYVKAEATAKDALRINTAIFGKNSYPVAISSYELSLVQLAAGRPADGEKNASAGYRILEALKLTDSDFYSTRLLDVQARAQTDLGNFAAADATFKALLAIDAKQLGTKHPKYVTHQANYAGLKAAQGDINTAKKYLLQAIAVYVGVLKLPKHINLIDIYSSLGALLRQRKANSAELKEAGKYLLLALQLDESFRGKDHELVANDHANLGRWAYDSKDRKSALASFSRSIAIYAKNVKLNRLSSDHPFVAEANTWKGRLLVEAGAVEGGKQAEPLLEAAVASWPVNLGAGTIGEGIAKACLGRALFIQSKDLGRARQLLNEAYAILNDRAGGPHPFAKQVAQWLQEIGRASAA
ncbi:MAG TPA: tetratricopeptide repeat protein [Steroidobacteraceae bacterium]|nr:tetratricopeptide repeat protein [Steroidobacteraceae bacterium]